MKSCPFLRDSRKTFTSYWGNRNQAKCGGWDLRGQCSRWKIPCRPRPRGGRGPAKHEAHEAWSCRTNGHLCYVLKTSNRWPAGETALATNHKHFSEIEHCFWLHLIFTCWYFGERTIVLGCSPMLRKWFPPWERQSSGLLVAMAVWIPAWLTGTRTRFNCWLFLLHQVWPQASWHILWGSNVTLRYLVPEKCSIPLIY